MYSTNSTNLLLLLHLKIFTRRKQKKGIAVMCQMTYRYGERNAVYSDTQLVGRVTVVVISQMLHELCQIYFPSDLFPKII